MSAKKKTSPMQVTIRLYRQHDMDLVGLYRTKDFKFQMHMKSALRAYAQGKDYRIDHPGDEDIKKGYVPKIVQIHIYLNPEKDQEAIDMLKTIRTGQRGAFLKALFRKYLNNEPLAAYKSRKDLIFNAEEDYLISPEEAGIKVETKEQNKNENHKTDGKNSGSDGVRKKEYRERSENRNFVGQKRQDKPSRDLQRQQNISNQPKNVDPQTREKADQNGKRDNNNKHDHPEFKNEKIHKNGEHYENHQTKQKNEDIISKNSFNKEQKVVDTKKDNEESDSFSFFDRSAADEDLVWEENSSKKNNQPTRSTEADSQIPSSFFDNPDDDDTNEFLAQMQNLAH